MPVFWLVSRMASRIARWIGAGVREPGSSNGRPIQRTRTLLALSSSIRPNSLRCRPRMCRTSEGGRTQFSVLKPNTVSQPTPRADASRTTVARASSPAVCPAVRGRPRRFAQRPLPSMMQATCGATDMVAFRNYFVVRGCNGDGKRIEPCAGLRRLGARVGCDVGRRVATSRGPCGCCCTT